MDSGYTQVYRVPTSLQPFLKLGHLFDSSLWTRDFSFRDISEIFRKKNEKSRLLGISVQAAPGSFNQSQVSWFQMITTK